MSADPPGELKAIAAKLLRDTSDQLQQQADAERVRELVRVSTEHALSVQSSIQLSQAQLKNLIDAVGEDVGLTTEKTTRDDERLARVENQTRVLTEAVLAITQTAEIVAPAMRALKAQMQEADSSSSSLDSTRAASKPAAGHSVES